MYPPPSAHVFNVGQTSTTPCASDIKSILSQSSSTVSPHRAPTILCCHQPHSLLGLGVARIQFRCLASVTGRDCADMAEAALGVPTMASDISVNMYIRYRALDCIACNV